jgi:hypothetical protein
MFDGSSLRLVTIYLRANTLLSSNQYYQHVRAVGKATRAIACLAMLTFSKSNDESHNNKKLHYYTALLIVA